MLPLQLKHKPKLLLFDFDDTLIPSTEVYQKCYLDLKLDLSYLERAKAIIKNRLGPGHVSAHQRLLYFKIYLELLNQFSPENLFNLIESYEKRLSFYFTDSWSKLGRDRLMKSLKSKFSLAIVTNENTRTQLLKLNAIDPEMKHFDFIITSEEVGVEKPNSLIFNECLQRSNQNINDVLMIGDSIKNDLEPIQQLGGQVLGTSEFISPDKKAHYHWLHKLDDLIALVEG